MRLLKLGVYYPTYLAQFYSERPGLSSASFARQHTELMDDCFGSSNFWTCALNKFGYETSDLTINAEPLQRRWAIDHGLVFDESNWLFEITAAQVKEFEPDVLLIADYTTVTAEFVRHLRSTCPTIRLILGWCGAPYQEDSVFHEFDLVLSCVPELVAKFEREGHSSRHVNHAFAPRVLDKIGQTNQPTIDFSFIGSIVKSDQFHVEREKLLSALVRETDLCIWSEVLKPSAGVDRSVRMPSFGASLRSVRKLFKPSVNGGGIDPEITRRARTPLFGLKMFKQLRDSRVTLNNHIDISVHSASNMRLFEATGVGACLLTDWKANITTLFADDTEVVTYRNAGECVEKVKYLLEHESERRAIALAGQRRTLSDHTFEQRASRIDAIIREALVS